MNAILRSFVAAAAFACAAGSVLSADGSSSVPAHGNGSGLSAIEAPAVPSLCTGLADPGLSLRLGFEPTLQEDMDRSLGRDEYFARSRHGRNFPFAVSLSAGAAVLLPSKAGRMMAGSPPREEPSIDRTHGTGFVSALSARWSVRNGLSVTAMLGFERHPGRTLEEGVLGRVEYGAMTMYPVLFGARVHLPLNTELKTWFKQDFSPGLRGLCPFAAVLVGGAYRDQVQAAGAPYWNAAPVFSARCEVGISYGFGSILVEAGISLSYHSEPSEAVWYAECDAAMALSLTGALSAAF